MQEASCSWHVLLFRSHSGRWRGSELLDIVQLAAASALGCQREHVDVHAALVGDAQGVGQLVPEAGLGLDSAAAGTPAQGFLWSLRRSALLARSRNSST